MTTELINREAAANMLRELAGEIENNHRIRLTNIKHNRWTHNKSESLTLDWVYEEGLPATPEVHTFKHTVGCHYLLGSGACSCGQESVLGVLADELPA